MSHWAEIDPNNIVIRVVVVDNTMTDADAGGWVSANLGGIWVRCSYNNNIRKQYPGIGYSYDPVADMFISPQPFPSWALDVNHDWQAPTPMPQDGPLYFWNEATLGWVKP